MGRLLKAVTPELTERFAFDPAGNPVVDNYNPETNTGTMQLVKQEAHTGIQHAGGVSQYQAATGQPYTHPCRR